LNFENVEQMPVISKTEPHPGDLFSKSKSPGTNPSKLVFSLLSPRHVFVPLLSGVKRFVLLLPQFPPSPLKVEVCFRTLIYPNNLHPRRTKYFHKSPFTEIDVYSPPKQKQNLPTI